MKWHIICLIIIWWSLVNPIEGCAPSAITQVLPGVAHSAATPAPDQHTRSLLLWNKWQANNLLYGAYHFDCGWTPPPFSTRPGRVSFKPKKQLGKRRDSRPSSAERGSTTKRATGPKSAQSVNPNSCKPSAKDEKTTRIPLHMVLRPGVMLTKAGIRLRPMIARLGQDVGEYIVLWNDKGRFQAAIAHLLGRSCPLCEGTTGFGRIGSTKRSVIPPGDKERVWFRVQKVRCKDCGAITRILPTWCIPYKSHHAQTIQNVLENCWRRGNSYRDATAILNQSRPQDGQYVGHTLPYEWTIWLGGVAIHLPQFLVWLGLQLPRHGLMDEYFETGQWYRQSPHLCGHGPRPRIHGDLEHCPRRPQRHAGFQADLTATQASRRPSAGDHYRWLASNLEGRA